METGSSLITTVLPSDSFSADSFIRIGFKIQRKSAFSGVTILDISFGDSQLTMLKLLVSTEGENVKQTLFVLLNSQQINTYSGELQIAYNSSTGNYKLMLLSSTHNYSDGQFYDMKIHINLKNELSIEVSHICIIL